MNNTITEMKNTLEGINSRITEAEERIITINVNGLNAVMQLLRLDDKTKSKYV